MSGRPARVAFFVAPLVAATMLACAGPRAAGPGTAGADAPPPTPAATAPAAPDSVHPHELADLTPDGPYPRFTAAQLEASGYPDHLHAFFWPGWTPPRGEDGLPYGPGSLCAGGAPVARPDLAVAPGRVAHGPFLLLHDAGYRACDLAFYAELAAWARARCRTLLELDPAETLVVYSPDNLEEYQALTGYGSWRLYRFAPDTCIIEPAPTLLARTLAGHVAVETAVLHALAQATADALPPWLRLGLAGYVADMGAHLNNFMAPYRLEGPVLMTPAAIDSALAAAPDPDGSRDQRRFRRAGYGAFLMAWRLVEDGGGLAPLRGLIAAVAGGTSYAEACRHAYGTDPAGLAARLDPTEWPEPIGDSVQPRRPATPPGAGAR